MPLFSWEMIVISIQLVCLAVIGVVITKVLSDIREKLK